ncbi:gustatory receptor for sugar taste 43a-like isoform X2 [Thrips palmi]|nr:gustatory receptor for sugar taste 43a-like isoform X2 [Thrips palmi]
MVVTLTAVNVTPDFSNNYVAVNNTNATVVSGPMNHFVCWFDVVSVAVTAATSILQGAVAQAAVLRLIALLKKVDLLLSYIPRGVSNWVPLILSCLTSVMFLDLVFKFSISAASATFSFPTYASYFITYMREVMFVDDVNGLNARFANINSELQDCLAPEYTFGTVTAAEKRRMRISRLATVFDMLCQSADLVAHQYSLFLLCDMLSLMVRLVITAYFIVRVLMVSEDFPLAMVFFVIVQALWLLSHLARMFLLVAPCSTAMDVTDRTGNIVSSSLGRESQDSQLSRQLKSLSIHLLHRKIGFSAFGVFNLNLPLVCTVLSAVTTYLVVLIQLEVPLEGEAGLRVAHG